MTRARLLRLAVIAGLVLLALPSAAPASAAGTWQNAGDLKRSRAFQTATLLPNGQVLVAGGYRGQYSVTTATAELYDPVASAWTQTSSMSTPRAEHTATLLNDGTVLIAGGVTDSSNTDPAPVRTAELYDADAGVFTPTGRMSTSRADATATLLLDGSVLVAGGSSKKTAERYDPARGTWSAAGAMHNGRQAHTATLLPDGRVLVTGGSATIGSSTTYFASADIYDPATNTWSPAAPMGVARAGHSATLLPDGTVLVAGGRTDNSTLQDTLELYHPTTNTWSAAGSWPQPGANHTATLLPDGNVLFLGDMEPFQMGYLWLAVTHASVLAGRWLFNMPEHHSATLLGNGKVLEVGGFPNGFGLPAYDASLYTMNQLPATGAPVQSLRLGVLGTTTVPVLVSWTSSDPDGDALAAYQLQESLNGGTFTTVTLPTPTANGIVRDLTPGNQQRYRVYATDEALATGPFTSGPNLSLSAFQETAPQITFSGIWTASAQSGAFGGGVKFATVAGAQATFHFAGRSVAWVSTRGANRGIAVILLDGTQVATIDLYASTTQPRRIVWAANQLSSGAHTLQIRVTGTKNGASTGRRVELDAIVQLS